MADRSAVHESEYGEVTARYYDAAYGVVPTLGPDVDFYRELARKSGGPVLELGCGTGRVLLEIARDGIACLGLDASPSMLSMLEPRASGLPLRTHRARFEDFDLGAQRFPLIFSAFRALQHLDRVEDQLACLACVRHHLTPGGRLAFDVFNPRLDRLAQPEEPEREQLRFAFQGDEVVRYEHVRRDLARQTMQVVFRYERWHGGRVVGNERTRFTMRWFFRYELAHLLARAGFAEVEIFGDFERGPVTAESPALVVLAR